MEEFGVGALFNEFGCCSECRAGRGSPAAFTMPESATNSEGSTT